MPCCPAVSQDIHGETPHHTPWGGVSVRGGTTETHDVIAGHRSSSREQPSGNTSEYDPPSPSAWVSYTRCDHKNIRIRPAAYYMPVKWIRILIFYCFKICTRSTTAQKRFTEIKLCRVIESMRQLERVDEVVAGGHIPTTKRVRSPVSGSARKHQLGDNALGKKMRSISSKIEDFGKFPTAPLRSRAGKTHGSVLKPVRPSHQRAKPF